MALFKISKGTSKNLPSTLTEGYCWYTYDDSKWYIDYKDENGVLTRKALNAQNAETLCGKTLEELKAELTTQPDWAQNDPDAIDYIKNRTHWIDDNGEYHALDENFIPDTIARTSDIDGLEASKKDKDLIVTYRDGSVHYITHSSEQMYEAFQNGRSIYFQKNLELLSLLEINNDYATFYMYYVTQDGKPRQQIVAISGNSIIMELDDEYDYATANQLANKADKQHTHAISDVTNLQTELDARVSAKRTINGKSLEADISLTADDVGADTSGSAAAALSEAKTYTDTAANNLQQQIDSLIPVFIGTQEQYNAKEPEIPVGALVIITDTEIDVNDDDAVSAILGKGKLGYLILN